MRLKDTSISAVVLLAALLSPGAGGLAPLAAQSLADVARQEQERRKGIKATAKVLTNEDLRAVPPFTPPADAPEPPAVDGATPAEPDKDAPATQDPAQAQPANDQAYWSGRWKDLQTRLARNEAFAVAQQSLVNAKQTEYDNASDGVRQLALAAERQRAIADLDRLKKEIEDDKKAIAALQEEARVARVPPGWLR